MTEWHDFVAEQREHDLVAIIKEEKLKEAETRKFLDNSFREDEIKIVGTILSILLRKFMFKDNCLSVQSVCSADIR